MLKRGWKARYDSPAQRKARHKKKLRRERLTAPIAERDIARFTRHLLAISFQGSECWFYVPIGRRGAMPAEFEFSTVNYATATCNGEQVNAHRFALAAHLSVSYLSLDGWDVHHIKGCIGYRCQNPEHLEKTKMREHRGSRGVSGDRRTRSYPCRCSVQDTGRGCRLDPPGVVYTHIRGTGSSSTLLAIQPISMRLGTQLYW
jgi:hypothetical protein